MNERVNRAMNMVGIGELKDRLPSAISGGQQQRVAFARAIVYDPGVLLFLLSERSAFTTGQTLVADGGRVLVP